MFAAQKLVGLYVILSITAYAQGVLAVTLSSSSITFNGKQVILTTSGPKSVTLTNSGTAPLTISSITASGDFAATNDCGASVAAGAKCKITVTFTPTAAGTRNGVVTITDNAAGSPQTIALDGTGQEPVTLSPGSLTFSTQVVGSSSAASVVTLKNNQVTGLSISSIVASGDFAQTTSCGGTVAPGATCTINVTFTPTAMGGRSGAVTITHNAVTSPGVIPLSGTGIVNLTLSSGSLNLGNQTVGTTGAIQIATLTNSSSIPIAIGGIVATGDFTQTSNCGSSLAAGTGCTISVQFAPTAIGPRTGAVTITDAATNSPQVLSLTGNGVAPPVTISPGSLSFANQLVGTTSAPLAATLTNTGNGIVTNIVIVASGDFSQTNTCPSSLSSGASCVISVRFAPTVASARSGSVTGTNSASNSPQVLGLSGLGFALASIAVTPANPSMLLGNTQQFTATGTFTDGSTQNLTSSATWSSSATNVATINNAGLATSVGIGSTTITAASGSISGQTALTVTSPSPFTATGSMTSSRHGHTATLLNNGSVLLAGGHSGTAFLASAELYDPATGIFTSTGSMTSARYLHTATLLNNGKVLIAGGYYGGSLTSAELYDPATGTFTATGSMTSPRDAHSATLLNNGKVLIAGGENAFGGFASVASAELYDPATGTFTATGSMTTARNLQTGTLLNNGKVIIAGGYTGAGVTASAELYDPATGTFSPTGSMTGARYIQTGTLLNNGKVLLAAGWTSASGPASASAELYDPATGIFSAPGSMAGARFYQTATLLNNGNVLLAGGHSGSAILASAELYQPTTLTPAGLVSIAVSPAYPTISPTGTQQFVATGTFSDSSTQTLASVTWSSSSPSVAAISNDASNHGVAVPAGSGMTTITASAGLVSGSTTLTVRTAGFVSTGSMTTARLEHTATLLNNGKVLLAGGYNETGGYLYLASAELFDPVTGTFTATGSMTSVRLEHRATLLNNGKVLLTGGHSGTAFLASAELYDPATGIFTATGSMTITRDYHTVTLLNNGKVLLVGGQGGGASAEVYDPVTGTFTATGSMTIARYLHTATLLNNGKVLIAGGALGGGASAEVYDPATGIFTATGSMTYRYLHTATLLNNGKVLIAGGQPSTASAELYDPATGIFSATGSMTSAHFYHTATLLNNGRVLISGGRSATAYLASAELYDPATGIFTATGSMTSARALHTATLLNNGMVLVAGGETSAVLASASADLY